MKLKWGALVVDGRGKIGGHVGSKNRAGSYLRTKVTPTNPQTLYQSTARNRFSSFSQGWRGFTEAERSAWNAAVGDFQRTDIFGDIKSPTGINLSQRLNNNLSIVGATLLSSPPSPVAVQNVVLTSVVAASAAETVTINLSTTVDANTALKVYATASLSAGKSFVKSQYRLIAVLPSGETGSVDISVAYNSRFGTTGSIGKKIFVKIQAVNTDSGLVGVPTSASSVMVA